MSYAVQFRRGTTAEHASFTGAAGEITVNTTTNQLIVHDGVTVGGHVVGSGGGTGGASTLTDLNISDGTDGQVLTTDGAGTFTFTTLSNSGGGGGGDISSIISPSAFAYVNTISDGSGTNISWSNWNGASGTMDFTFATAQSDVNYAVISDVEGFDDINIQVSSKSTTGFTVTIYNDSGNVGNPSTTAAFSIMVYSSVPSPSSSANTSSTEILADMPALIAKTGMSAGDQVYLTSNNNLYFYTGTGWYLIATVQNNAPSAITNVNSSYKLNGDGTPTVITAAATDPEGFPLTWSYAITSGSLGSTATISQADNVFTITPGADRADEGEFTLAISATDGTNGAVSTTTVLSLFFNITNSRYTQLLVTAVDTSNNDIIDHSSNNHTVSLVGDPIANTFSPFRHGGYSMYFDGSGGDWVKSDTHADFGFGTDDFTIECWYYPVSKLQSYPRIWNFGPFWQNSQSLAFVDRHNDNNTVLTLNSWTAGEILRSTTTIEDGKWYHLTVERSGTTITLYVNGVSEDTYDAGTSEFITSSPSYVTIGNVSDGSNLYESALHGNIKDFRYVKGTAIYGTNFTPPTEPLTEVTNTKLLTAQGLQFSDVSANNHSMSKTGDVSTMPFTPYDYAEYDSTDHGGSIYFPDSGGLHIPSESVGTVSDDDFTAECWFYQEEPGGNCTLFDKDGRANTSFAQVSLSTTTSKEIYAYLGTGNGVYGYQVIETGSNVFDLSTWNHVALVKDANTIKIYVNGNLQAEETITTTITDGGKPLYIGMRGTGDVRFHGYIADFRFVKGQALYNSNFVPNSLPATSTGMDIHLKGTESSIIDKTQNKTILTLEGNTTGSTTQVKFTNSKSIYVDGSGDNVTITDLEMGSADLTFELWMYQDIAQSASYRGILSASSYTDSNPFTLYTHNSTLQLWLNQMDPSPSASGPFTAFTWHHVAIVRNSGTWTLYIDGISVGTSTTGGTYNFTNTIDFLLGQRTGGSYDWKGYLQDVRFTKGVARYTTNFTPPTSSLKG